jgi:hypothetical protein
VASETARFAREDADSCEKEGGADTRIRTEDLLFTKQLLYR